MEGVETLDNNRKRAISDSGSDAPPKNKAIVDSLSDDADDDQENGNKSVIDESHDADTESVDEESVASQSIITTTPDDDPHRERISRSTSHHLVNLIV